MAFLVLFEGFTYLITVISVINVDVWLDVKLLSMGLDYSYTQPSDSEEYGGNTADSGYIETEDLIRQDQAEIDTQRAPVQYPPQPEV
ncbi:unnamed protein product, partial [Brassica oleracea var. botrytis]